MPELIDKVKVLKYLTPRIKTETPYGEAYNRALEDAAALVALMPTIEAEQRHGEWKCIGEYEEFSEEMADYLCVNCGYVISRLKNQKPNFCENCGRDMRATDTNVGGKGGDDNV